MDGLMSGFFFFLVKATLPTGVTSSVGGCCFVVCVFMYKNMVTLYK